MSLINLLKEDLKQARLDRDSYKVGVLTTLYGEAVSIGKNAGNRETTDAKGIALIRKFIKGLDENIAIYGDRREGDKVDELSKEKDLLETYLPQQIKEDDLRVLLQTAKANGFTDKGRLMKFLKDNFSGQYDGKVAASVVDSVLKEVAAQ